MKFNFKRKYWWINYRWNKGKDVYKVKNWRISRSVLKTYQDRHLNIPHIIELFNSDPELFQTIKYFNIIRKRRNIFSNISTLRGRIVKKSSCGVFYKRGSERRTYVAFNELLEQVSPNNFKALQTNRYIIRVRANNHYKTGFKRNIRLFLKSRSIKIYKQIGIKFKAHNGVRKKKKKRK